MILDATYIKENDFADEKHDTKKDQYVYEHILTTIANRS